MVKVEKVDRMISIRETQYDEFIRLKEKLEDKVGFNVTLRSFFDQLLETYRMEGKKQ